MSENAYEAFDLASAVSPVAVFAVHDEGDDLRSLYLWPCDLAVVADALVRVGAGDTLHDVAGTRPLAIEPDVLPRLRPPFELVHAPDGAVAGCSVLADPHGALREGSGRRVALAQHDDDHLVCWSRDESVLAALLEAFLGDRIDDLAAGRAPRISPRAVGALLEPIEPGSWCEARLDDHGRFWVLRIDTMVADRAIGAHAVHASRWVGAPGRTWRDGWDATLARLAPPRSRST